MPIVETVRPKVKLRLNDLDTFSTTVKNTPENRELWTLKKDVTLRCVDVDLIKGIVTNLKLGEDVIEVIGIERCWKLSKKTFEKPSGNYLVQYDNVQAKTIFEDILACHGSEFTVAEAPLTLVSCRFENMDCLNAIASLAQALDLDWKFVGTQLYVKTWGSNKGEIKPILPVKEESCLESAGKIIGLGYGEGINQLRKIVEDPESPYADWEFLFSDRKIIHGDTLEDLANSELSLRKNSIHSIPITLNIEKALELEPGDTVTIEKPELKISGGYRILEMNFKEVSCELQIENVKYSLERGARERDRRLTTEERFAQGATSIISYDFSDSCDDVKPMEKKIFIPSKAIAINHVFVSFSIRNFRAYAKSAASKNLGTKTSESGGGTTESTTYTTPSHTHEVSGQTAQSSGGHGHSFQNMDALTDVADGHQHWYKRLAEIFSVSGHIHDVSGVTSSEGGASHKHSVTIPDHDHDVVLGSHVHDLVFGIFEETITSPNVGIKIDGVDRTGALGGPWTSDQSEINITQYIASTGWHTIELTANKRMRLAGCVLVQVFIQSN